jgi:hypothetical protein
MKSSENAAQSRDDDLDTDLGVDAARRRLYKLVLTLPEIPTDFEYGTATSLPPNQSR